MDVKKVGFLANLPLSDEELTTYSGQLEKILEYVDQLQKTDISQAASTSEVSNLKNVTRADSVEAHTPLVAGHIKVKAIFNND